MTSKRNLIPPSATKATLPSSKLTRFLKIAMDFSIIPALRPSLSSEMKCKRSLVAPPLTILLLFSSIEDKL